jgi:hypothetical protein
MNKKQTIKLATILGIGSVTGTIAIAAASGLFRLNNVLMIAFAFIAGPGAIINSALLDGNTKERIISAIIAGLIATIFVTLSAGFGPKLLGSFNLNLIKIFGGLSIILIGLIIMGVKIPESSPILIMLFGLVIGGLLR